MEELSIWGWIVIYLIGFIITALLMKWYNNDQILREDDMTAIAIICVLCPITLPVCILYIFFYVLGVVLKRILKL